MDELVKTVKDLCDLSKLAVQAFKTDFMTVNLE